MALKIRDIMRIEPVDKMTLLAGSGGLDNLVCSVGVADYEFIDDFQERTRNSEDAFLKDSFVISSLLFAHRDSSRILPAVKILHGFGVAGFAFKNVLFKELPPEVLDFAEEHNFPVFVFERELVFEDIIYKITEEIHAEDNYFLSEEHIEAMIHSRLSVRQIERIAKGVSLIFKQYAMGVYIMPRTRAEAFEIERVFRNIHLNKQLKNKTMISRYQKGLFLIVTCPQEDERKFELIIREFLETSSLHQSEIQLCRSGIHHPYEELDQCIRESYFTWLAATVSGPGYAHFSEIGAFQYLIPLKDNPAMATFSEKLMTPLLDKEDLLQTLITFVQSRGDLAETAAAFQCHQNTIRYRLSRVRELLALDGTTDHEFYECISTAVKIYLLKKEISE